MAATPPKPAGQAQSGTPASTVSSAVAARKPYARPAVVYQQVLEAVAANCSVTTSKAPGTCTFGFS